MSRSARLLRWNLFQECDEAAAHRLRLLYLRRRMQIRTRNDINNRALPLPEESAWARLYATGDDASFINNVGIDRASFESILIPFSEHYKVRYHRRKGGRPCKISKPQALGMVLQFYASTLELKNLGQLHGCRKNVASRCIEKAENALHKAWPEIPLGHIRWPSIHTQEDWARLVENRYPLIKGRFGFVDGKNFRVQEPSDIDEQNAMYNGWLHSAFITGVLCFGISGELIWGKHNVVGSWNDADNSSGLFERLLSSDTKDELGVMSDSAFPVTGLMRSKIISPLKEGDLEKSHPEVQHVLAQLSSSITSCRQACEWGVGSVEKVWRQLLLPLPFNPDTRRVRLDNIFRLWNLRVRTTHITQIGSVFTSGVY